MRILMLCEFYDPRLEYQENLLVKYYRKHGHDVTVLTSTFDNVGDYYADRHNHKKPASEFHDQGAKIIRLPYRYNFANRLRAYTPIRSILDRFAPDFIFVHDIMLNIPEIVRYVKQNPNCRVIMDYHADYSNSGKNWVSIKVLHGIIRKWFFSELRPYLSAIFPIVPASATFLHEVYGVAHEDMEILPLGADTDLIAEVKSLRRGQGIRHYHNIKEDETVIFTGGKLDTKKRTEILIDAVNSIPNEKLHLFIVGDATNASSPYKNELVKLSSSNPRIHFTGWLDPRQIYEHLDASDFAVFPASQSIMWQQAIAAGLPLVVGDTGGQDISYLNLEKNIEILREEEISVSSITGIINDFLEHPLKLDRMRIGAAKVAKENLDWNLLVETTLRSNRAQR